MGRTWEVFLVFLRLGLTSFGGPIAHIGYFRDEFVSRRHWLSERSYADLVALCQFLPGPASSQVGMALGLSRSGYAGAFAAWVGFTLPSALLLILLAMGLANHGGNVPPGVLHGLKVVAMAVVAHAIWGMARTLCPDLPRILIMAIAACAALFLPSTGGQLAIITIAGLVGLSILRPSLVHSHDAFPVPISRRVGTAWLTLFFVLLFTLPLLARLTSSLALTQAGTFFHTGALVFGGGHVVLPLLQTAVVSAGWVDGDTFLAGYGATQAIPGPLFTFAAFLGASMKIGPSGWTGGLICLGAIFAPSFLLMA
ncbi:MAG: chromate efflux transporter, partial [Chitinimonas sp.]|nr:chromate efflux transporter [Chitinimonas sp.]